MTQKCGERIVCFQMYVCPQFSKQISKAKHLTPGLSLQCCGMSKSNWMTVLGLDYHLDGHKDIISITASMSDMAVENPQYLPLPPSRDGGRACRVKAKIKAWDPQRKKGSCTDSMTT